MAKTRQESGIIKWLAIGLVLSAILNIYAYFISPLTKGNVWMTLAFAAIVIVFLVLQFLSSMKPKANVFDAAGDISKAYLKSGLPGTGNGLDTSIDNWFAWPLGPLKYLIHFSRENRGYIWDNAVITAQDPKAYADTLKFIETSEVFKEYMQAEVGKKRLAEKAKDLGIDPESAGIQTTKEDDDDEQ
jgi:hypothetical protein